MDLDGLERLLREATAGPWISDDGIVTSDTREIHNEPPFIRGGACVMVAANLRDQDADLIAAIRNSAEELIRDARRYRWLVDLAEFSSPGGWVCADDSVEDKGKWIDEAIAQEGKG